MSGSLVRVIGAVLGYVPGFLVLALLGFVAYWGHTNHWEYPSAEEKKETTAEPEEETPPPVRLVEVETPWGYSPFDVTLPITHDPAKCPHDGKLVEFSDASVGRRAGIRTGVVREREMTAVLNTSASTDFDPTRVVSIRPRIGGVVLMMEKEVGQKVAPGELLAVIDSADVGKAKAAFLAAKVHLDVKRQIRDSLQVGVVPQRTILEADTALQEAEAQLYASHQSLLNLRLPIKLADVEKLSAKELSERLQFLGLPKSLIDTMPGETSANLLPIFNPFNHDAVVLARDGVAGENVREDKVLFVIGDPTAMQVFVDVRQEDASRLAFGQSVEFIPEGNREISYRGKIDWISSVIDPGTRTLRARVRVDNSAAKLRAHTFGQARIILRQNANALTVPEAAVQWEGCSPIVFVQEDPKKFHVRRVQLGIHQEGFVEVISGLKAGEVVVVLGSHVLKSELFKERIGSPEE